MKRLARVRDNPFLRFLVVGGFAAAANFGSRFVFSRGVSYETAVTLAWCVGITTAFTLSRLYVFEGARHGSVWRQFAGFTLVNLFALLQTVTGVGPRLAMATLAVLEPDALRRALAESDTKSLTSVPGIGKRVAERLCVELRDKVDRPTGEASTGVTVVGGMVMLGWIFDKIGRAHV